MNNSYSLTNLEVAAVEFEKLEAIDDGFLADAGEPRNAVERRAHLWIAST
jgi:hypothetical protein